MNDDLELPHGLPGPFLALFDGEACRFQVHARSDALRDGVDPVSELATLASIVGLRRAAMFLPVRMRDLVDDEIVSRSMLLTRVERLPDGRLELDAYAIAGVDDDGDPSAPPQPMEPALSPVGSLLCDVLSTTDLSVRAEEAVAVLQAWGHVVVTDESWDLPPVDHARLDRARYHLHRTADELGRRHRPMATADDPRRPAAPANLPPGFLPACPL